MLRTDHTNVRVDWYTRACLTVISVLLTVLIIGLWAQNVPGPDHACAAEQFQPARGQRQSIISGQNMSERKLDELMTLLKSGQDSHA